MRHFRIYMKSPRRAGNRSFPHNKCDHPLKNKSPIDPRKVRNLIDGLDAWQGIPGQQCTGFINRNKLRESKTNEAERNYDDCGKSGGNPLANFQIFHRILL